MGRARILTLVALAQALACGVPNDSPVMLPGENCQACHGGEGRLWLGERKRHAQAWTVSGTVFDPANPAQGVEGANVTIADAKGFSFSLRTNLAGNFYSAESVQFPLTACIERDGRKVCQKSPVTSGACNDCHNLAVLGAPQPPLVAP